MRFWRALFAAASFWALSIPTHAATLTITNTGTNTGAVGVRTPAGGGICNPPGGGVCTFTFPAGTPVNLAANSPATPGVFSAGTGDASGCGTSTCAFVINGDSSITATFNMGTPSVAIHIALAGDGAGNVGADNNQCQNFELGFSACTINYAPGSVATLQGRSMPGNIFTAFSDGMADASGCGAASTCVFTLNSASSMTANFSRLTAVAVQPGSATITVGQSQPFSAIGTFSSVQTRSLQGGSGSWNSKRALLFPTFDFGIAALNQKLYAVGGGIGGSPSSFVEVYNPAVGALGLTDSWTSLAGLQTKRMGHGVAAVGGKVYAIGGSTTGNLPIASVEIYDPSTDTWDGSTAAPMPTARSQFATAVVGSAIYALGGGDVASPLQIVEAYDTTTNTWSTKAPMPTGRTFFAAAAAGGTIYAFGDPGGSVDAYNTSTDTWSSKAPMPHPRSTLAAGAIDGLIYAVGGQNPNMTGTVDVYHPATNTWTTLASMPTPRGEVALGVLDGRLWVAGGLAAVDSSSVIATFQAFRPPETTWWSTNTTVATINNGSANATGQNPGTTTIDARAVGVDCATTNTCATLTVAGNGGGGGGGGGGECANVTFLLAPGSALFTTIDLTLIDPSTGQPRGTFTAPIGQTLTAHAGAIRVAFTAPNGFTVSPTQVDLNIQCGDDIHVQLRFSPIDTVAPVISSVTPSVGSLWPPDHRMVAVSIAVSSTDNVDASPSCSVSGVTSNEPANGLGDGDTAPDWTFDRHGLAVNLRAERAGKGSGRIYTITVTCADHAGNSSSGSTTVVVPHDRKP